MPETLPAQWSVGGMSPHSTTTRCRIASAKPKQGESLTGIAKDPPEGVVRIEIRVLLPHEHTRPTTVVSVGKTPSWAIRRSMRGLLTSSPPPASSAHPPRGRAPSQPPQLICRTLHPLIRQKAGTQLAHLLAHLRHQFPPDGNAGQVERCGRHLSVGGGGRKFSNTHIASSAWYACRAGGLAAIAILSPSGRTLRP